MWQLMCCFSRQAYFHNTGMHGCPRPCLPQEELRKKHTFWPWKTDVFGQFLAFFFPVLQLQTAVPLGGFESLILKILAKKPDKTSQAFQFYTFYLPDTCIYNILWFTVDKHFMMKLLTFPQSHLALEEKCVKFGPVYPGMKAVLWVRNDGMTLARA